MLDVPRLLLQRRLDVRNITTFDDPQTFNNIEVFKAQILSWPDKSKSIKSVIPKLSAYIMVLIYLNYVRGMYDYGN